MSDWFTIDHIDKDTLFAYYTFTDLKAYLKSLECVAALPVRRTTAWIFSRKYFAECVIPSGS